MLSFFYAEIGILKNIFTKSLESSIFRNYQIHLCKSSHFNDFYKGRIYKMKSLFMVFFNWDYPNKDYNLQ